MITKARWILSGKLIVFLCAGLLWVCKATTAAPITIDTVPVGNLGNVADTTGFGAVADYYRIGTTEVTNAQYAAFLNAKAASDPLALYNTNMGSNAHGGISRSGSDGSYTYTTKTNMADKPVNYVSWYDSVRFANWLHNGQGAGDTETGAYTLLGGTSTPSNGNSITRNIGATWFLTSEDEWYKAAYYQPAAEGGDSNDYWLYPTASNNAPTVATANSVGDISNPGANVANYGSGADWDSLNGNVTTVGSAGPLSESFYGTSDQGGNVVEWNESLVSGSRRGHLGGSFIHDFASDLSALSRKSGVPAAEDVNVGFRVATVPEPSSLALAAMGLLGLLAFARRRNRHVTRLLMLPALLCLLTAADSSRAANIRSTFDANDESWTSNEDAQFVPVGGNPGGYLRLTDVDQSAPPEATVVAPAKFLGDQSAFEGQEISFDAILQSGSSGTATGFGIITLDNSDLRSDFIDNDADGDTDEIDEGMAIFDLAPTTPSTSWQTYSAPLDEANWVPFDALSTGYFGDILRNLTGVRVVLDVTSNSGEIVGFDNFVIGVVPEPSTAVYATSAFAAFGLYVAQRRKRRRCNDAK